MMSRRRRSIVQIGQNRHWCVGVCILALHLGWNPLFASEVECTDRALTTLRAHAFVAEFEAVADQIDSSAVGRQFTAALGSGEVEFVFSQMDRCQEREHFSMTAEAHGDLLLQATDIHETLGEVVPNVNRRLSTRATAAALEDAQATGPSTYAWHLLPLHLLPLPLGG